MIYETVIYVAVASFIIGTAGIVLSSNLIKKILSLGIIETAVIVFYVGISARTGTEVPIVNDLQNLSVNYADPVPQAVIITSIVIGFALLCLSLVFAVLIYNEYHTMDVKTIEKIFERED